MRNVCDGIAIGDAPSNASILDAANVLVEISQRYLFHHPSMRARIERGARYACYPQLTERYLTDSVVDADRYVEQLRRDETVCPDPADVR